MFNKIVLSPRSGPFSFRKHTQREREREREKERENERDILFGFSAADVK